ARLPALPRSAPRATKLRMVTLFEPARPGAVIETEELGAVPTWEGIWESRCPPRVVGPRAGAEAARHIVLTAKREAAQPVAASRLAETSPMPPAKVANIELSTVMVRLPSRLAAPVKVSALPPPMVKFASMTVALATECGPFSAISVTGPIERLPVPKAVLLP